jgi:hypothetical protein
MKAAFFGLIAVATLAILVLLSVTELGAGVFLAIIEALTPPSG